MLIETATHPWKKALTTSATDTSFPSRIPRATEPTHDGVHALSASPYNGGLAQNGLVLVPYGLGDDDDVFAMRVIGWRRLGDDIATLIWVPVILAELTCTMSTAVGLAGRLILNTERFCDTIALVTGNDDVSVDIVSPTGNVIAHAILDLKGFQKVEFTFDTTTGDPTNCNCLFALL